MTSYAVAFLVSLFSSAMLTPLVRRLTQQTRLVDLPNDRKIHSRGIPRTGGIAIAITFLLPVLGIAATRANIGQAFYRNAHLVEALVLGSLMIFCVGLYDDLKGLRARWKFVLQIAVATFAYWMGFRIEAVTLPFVGLLEMGMFSYLITVVWIVGIVNAVNLIDGLDGLAGGIAFLVLVFNFAVAYTNNSVMMALVSAALGGAVLGFLIYNFNPASIFMGDAGSMFIGYVLSLAAINSGQKSSTTVALLTPVVAMGLPIMDTLFSMFRRFLERRPLFAPDSGHIHHRLLAMGLNHRRSVMVLYSFAVMLVVLASLLHFGSNWQVGVALVVVFVALAVFARVVGMAEYVSRRRATRLGIRSPHAEALRRICYDAQQRADGVTTTEEMTDFLSWLLRVSDMKFLEVCDENEAVLLKVENPAYRAAPREPLVVAMLPLQGPDGGVLGSWRVGWHSERGKVTTVTETLLQIIADRVKLRGG